MLKPSFQAGLAILVLSGCVDDEVDEEMTRRSRIGFDMQRRLDDDRMPDAAPIQIVARGLLDREEAARRGLHVNTQVEDYSTLFVTPDQVETLLSTFPEVTIDAAQPVELQSDASVTEIEAYRMWGYEAMPPIGVQPTYPGASGRRVLVGIIDTGIDVWHPDLRRPCRGGEIPSPNTGDCSRIVAVWNQKDIMHTKPPGFAYGSEFGTASINNGTAVIGEQTSGLTFFNPNDAAVSEYMGGHGTLTAGVATGNGRGVARCAASGACDPQWKYFGVAPEADIAVVMLGNLSDGSVVDGVNYLKQKAAALGQPIVINLSLGSNAGPHDGSSFLDRAVSSLAGPGVLISAAAGNYGGSANHARVDPGVGETVSIPFTLPVRSTTTENSFIAIEGWHDLTTAFDVQLVSPSGITTAIVAPGEDSGDMMTADGRLWLQNDAAIDSTSTAKRIYVNVQCRAFGDALPVAGTWTIKATRRTGSGAGALDLWLVSWKYPVEQTQTIRVPQFSGFGADPTHTITSPGTADNVITSGAYASQVRWTTYDGGTSLYAGNPTLQTVAPFSSLGPRRDGGMKPDLVAPGFGVFTSLAASLRDYTSTIWKSVDGVHRMSYGTSMSAAHTTGALALLLEQNASLTPTQAKAILSARARHDIFTGTTWSRAYGNGKLDLAPASPSAATSLVERVIVGNSRGFGIGSVAPDPSGLLRAPGFQVVVRDASGVGIPGVPVTLDFTGTPVKLAADQHDGSIGNCATRTLVATTGVDGIATFKPTFGRYVDTKSVRVTAGGVLLGMAAARSVDLDGNGTVGLGDLSLLSEAMLSAPATQSTDFDQSGATALGDLAILQAELVTSHVHTLCP